MTGLLVFTLFVAAFAVSLYAIFATIAERGDYIVALLSGRARAETMRGQPPRTVTTPRAAVRLVASRTVPAVRQVPQPTRVAA